MPYDSTLIPKGYTAADIHTYYYDELHRRWTVLKSAGLDTEHAVAMAETTHFTDVINGIIKVPESPETQNYVPTGISELKAADPGAGIQQVEAPSASQNGAAGLTFPFELPEGRNGIGASAGLQYSSDGGSSLAGYGWSLPVQSIDIETRWGVPRFETDFESESYLLMGQQLNDRHYRRADSLKRVSDKRFYPTVEGSFSKIIRRGDSPRNYYWEVTDKNGTVYSYGGSGADDESSLTDGDGNRIRWALRRITDVHGNFAAFHYTKAGNNLYPREYTWTGFGEEEGLHSVTFDIDTVAGDRKDAVSSGRLGILQTDRALLRRVTVKNGGKQLRAYTFNYETGAFGKTLLTGISQLDSKDAEIASQHFDYYNDIEKGLFAEEEEIWTVKKGQKKYHEKLRRLTNALNDIISDDLSILGGGYSEGKTTGGGLMVGVGFSEFSGNINVGASYSHTKNESRGKAALVDIDGDGLPDKVFQYENKLYYCKNLGADGKEKGFGEGVRIEGIEGFSASTSTSNSFNADAGIKYGIGSAGVSYTKTKEQEKTRIYLNDFNSDGLVDIAKNGVVYFNNIVNGVPKFQLTSTCTANPITGTGLGLSEEFLPDYEAERDSLEREYPLSDAVRMWRAPFDGDINVASEITKYGSDGDGIVYTIQHEDSKDVFRDTLASAGSREYNGKYTVKAGDRIFFRLQSRYSGLADEVKWNPVITYDSIYSGIRDYLGTDLVTYDSKKDFIEGETSTATAYKAGRFTVNAPYTKQKTSDDVLLKVTMVTKSNSIILKEDLLKADSIITDGEFTYSIVVQENDSTDLFLHGDRLTHRLEEHRMAAGVLLRQARCQREDTAHHSFAHDVQQAAYHCCTGHILRRDG